MLNPIKRESGSTDSERYLSQLSEKTFFGLWSYPNLYTNEGWAQTGTGKELCDLLVIFHNTAIVFSDKDIFFNSEIDLMIAWKRWFKRAVIKSANQLFGAESWLRSHPHRVFLDKECNHPFPIDLDKKIENIHLVAVTRNSVRPAQSYWGGDSSGTFFQSFPLDVKESLENPFMIGDPFPDKAFVHILDEVSLDLLLTELDTISDFIEYLKEKETFIRSGKIIQSAGEEELLAFYRKGSNKQRLSGQFRHPTNNLEKDGPVSLDEGSWKEHLLSEEYSFRLGLKKSSLFWDNLIKQFSRHILAADVGRGANMGIETHERAIRELAAENRYARALLSKSFEEKFLEVPADRRSSRLVFSPSQADKLYVFLFFPRLIGSDYSSYMKKREGIMHAYALVTKYRYPSAKYIVIIATEPKMSEGRSEDVLVIENLAPLSEEEKYEAEKLSREERILCDVWSQRLNEFEVSAARPYRSREAKYGRNERCPCGSGKKFKKCCM